MTLSRLQGLVRLQRDILWSASRAVASGGVLVYSTCSVLPEEGEMVVESFLRTHPEFRLEAPELPDGLHGLRGMKDARRLYPHINDCNGFFIARLVRA
jgi:16S rRNA (cytosine967-C5)-methyltransferase